MSSCIKITISIRRHCHTAPLPNSLLLQSILHITSPTTWCHYSSNENYYYYRINARARLKVHTHTHTEVRIAFGVMLRRKSEKERKKVAEREWMRVIPVDLFCKCMGRKRKITFYDNVHVVWRQHITVSASVRIHNVCHTISNTIHAVKTMTTEDCAHSAFWNLPRNWTTPESKPQKCNDRNDKQQRKIVRHQDCCWSCRHVTVCCALRLEWMQNEIWSVLFHRAYSECEKVSFLFIYEDELCEHCGWAKSAYTRVHAQALIENGMKSDFCKQTNNVRANMTMNGR